MILFAEDARKMNQQVRRSQNWSGSICPMMVDLRCRTKVLHRWTRIPKSGIVFPMFGLKSNTEWVQCTEGRSAADASAPNRTGAFRFERLAGRETTPGWPAG